MTKRMHSMSLALQVFLLGYLLRPLLWSSYSGDDVPNSQGPAWQAFRGIDVWQFISAENRFWMRTQGRFFPASIAETAIIFQLFDTRLSYKILQLTMAILAWGTFVLFVGILTRNIHYAVIAGWLAIFGFQFRNFHDPLRQFSVQQPIVVIVFFLMLSLLLLATQTTSRRSFLVYLIPSGILWIIGCLTYETLYPLLLIPLLVIWSSLKHRRRIFAMVTFVLPTLMLLAFIAQLRSAAEAPSTAYQLNFETWRFIPTFTHQVTGAFPFSYPLASPADGVPRLGSGWGPSGYWDLLAMLASVALLTLVVRSRRPRPLDRPVKLLLAFTGTLLLVVPSSIIALTERWQNGEITWGTPYVSVFLSSFGLVLLALVLISRLVEQPWRGNALTWASASRFAAGSVGAVVVVFGPLLMYDINAWSVAVSSGLRTEREAFAALIQDGALNKVPAGATLITENASNWFWENGAFIQYFGGPKQLNVITPTDPLATTRCGVDLDCYKLVRTQAASGRIIPTVEHITARNN